MPYRGKSYAETCLFSVASTFAFKIKRLFVSLGKAHSGSKHLINHKMEPTREWTHEQLESDSVSKKDIVSFIQENANAQVRMSYALLITN
jgi:hypothetical protein